MTWKAWPRPAAFAFGGSTFPGFWRGIGRGRSLPSLEIETREMRFIHSLLLSLACPSGISNGAGAIAFCPPSPLLGKHAWFSPERPARRPVMCTRSIVATMCWAMPPPADKSSLPPPLGHTSGPCSCEECPSPDESSQFFLVDNRTKAGGQDWTELEGSVLCLACYEQFSRRGTLGRTKSRPLSEGDRRCTYEMCPRPDQSRKFYRIDRWSQAGGQDWTELEGSVLCRACFTQYSRAGTLERTLNKPLPEDERRCTYDKCKDPGKSRQYYRIDERNKAGRQDWTELEGEVLCKACYEQFLRRGTLERRKSNPLPDGDKRCTYHMCKNPDESRQYYQIDESSQAGGQDWTELKGSILCSACYEQFLRRGTLGRTRMARRWHGQAVQIHPSSGKGREQ